MPITEQWRQQVIKDLSQFEWLRIGATTEKKLKEKYPELRGRLLNALHYLVDKGLQFPVRRVDAYPCRGCGKDVVEQLFKLGFIQNTEIDLKIISLKKKMRQYYRNFVATKAELHKISDATKQFKI